MLSQWSLKWLNFLWKLAYNLNVVHYYPTYSSNSGQLILITSKNRCKNCLVYLSIAIYSIYPPFILYQILTYIQYNKIPATLKTKFLVKEIYMCLAYMIAIIHQLLRLTRWNDIPEFENEFLKFFKIRKVTESKPKANSVASSQFVETDKPHEAFGSFQIRKKKHDSTVAVATYICWVLFAGLFIAFTNTILIFKKPTTPHFFTSLCEPNQHCSIWIHKGFVAYHIWKWLYYYVRNWDTKYISIHLILDIRWINCKLLLTLRLPFRKWDW